MLKKISFFVILLIVMTSATTLDGRKVILLVSEHREGDPSTTNIQRMLFVYRNNLGFTKAQMPIVLMGFADSDTEQEHFDRLGFKAEDAPVLCVVEWGKPEEFGPKKVLSGAVVRKATEADVKSILDAFRASLPESP